jgi:NAD+ synthase
MGDTMKPNRTGKKIIKFIRAYFKSAGKRTAIVGLSGGLDSAATLVLCVRALGKKNVLSVLLPSASTPSDDLEDASGIATLLGVRAAKFEIEPMISSFRELAAGRLSRANISARARMIVLYSLAQRENGLVVGTGDKSELMLGYFTKYGDGGADIFPIGGLYKTEVRELAHYLGVPGKVADKPPSPALWLGQTAESELGFSYGEADKILAAIERGGKKQMLEKKFGKKTVAAIFERMEKNRHKLVPAPICKI